MGRTLQGLRVVITGASSGIGAALARELAQNGAHLLLTARRIDRLETLQRDLGKNVHVLKANVAESMDCLSVVREGETTLGGIDVLVCNAGYGEMKPILETDAQALKAMFATNVLGTTECIRAAVPRMLQQEPKSGIRGQIMIVSSGAARRGLPFFGVYSATKASQLSIAEALRVELHGTGIAVTTVHPVGTKTEFFEVAETRGGRKLPPRALGDVQQTAEQVAHAMVLAMIRPKVEVWPFRPARLALAFAAAFPRVADKVMRRARGKMDVP